MQLHMQTLCLRRETALKSDLSFLRAKLLEFLPLNEINENVDYIFETPELQRLLLEYVIKTLQVKGLIDPDENEVANTALELFFSQYLRAHLAWSQPVFEK